VDHIRQKRCRSRGGAPSGGVGGGGSLTEDGILVQIEVTFAQVDFVTTPRRACAGSGIYKKSKGKGGVCKRTPVTSLAEDTHTHTIPASKEVRAHSRQRTTRSRSGSTAPHASARTDHDILA
jgi:hypothetical protein